MMLPLARTPIELIRAKPGMFFASGRANDHELVAAVMQDIISAGSARFSATTAHGLVVIYSDTDWMASTEVDTSELFEGFHLPAYKRPNSFRAEVLVGATAAQWATRGLSGAANSQKGGDLIVQAGIKVEGATRWLIWTSVDT